MTEQTLLSAHMEPEQSKYKMFSQNTNVIMKAECDVYQWWLAWPYGLSKSTSDTLWAQKIFDLEDTDSSHIVDVSLCYYCKAKEDKDAKHDAICLLMEPYYCKLLCESMNLP